MSNNAVKSKQFIIIAATFGFLAVALGAFGAHGLEGVLEEKPMQRYQTAVNYMFYHTLALLAVAGLMRVNSDWFLKLSAYGFTVGVIVFSGSLFAYVFSGLGYFGMITPLGGLAFLFAWAFLVLGTLRNL